MNRLALREILDAMDGVAMILDPDLVIADVGWSNWGAFMRENDGTLLSPEKIIGRPVTAFIQEGEVRDGYERAFRDIVARRRRHLSIEFHCDSPGVSRLMRLSVTPLRGEQGEIAGLLYQSVLLQARARPPLPLFGAKVIASRTEDILTICCLCNRVAWPKGLSGHDAEWLDPVEYYRRGGVDDVQLSHGFCPPCFERFMADDGKLADLKATS